jgi:NAD(P)-dependent dehydrogenase (short-subunit alcohol dehydrogenase family)
MIRLDGKSCVITGAAFGIGRATALRFATEGARLIVTDLQAEPLLSLVAELRGAGAEVEAVIGDVSIIEDAQRMIQAAVDRYGRLDVLVANAGIIPLGDILESSAADWDQVMAIDGRGMWLTCKYAIAAMLESGGGAIVCLSSISGVEGQKRQSTYGPAKFVASGIAKHLAIEWADRGIRVNAVAPGTIRTERVMRLPNEPGGVEYLQAIEQAHPMGRIGDPSEVAAAILFLASPAAAMTTGHVLAVDGGYLAQ